MMSVNNIEIRGADFATHSCNCYYDDCCDCIRLIRHSHELSHSFQPHSPPNWWWQSELDLFAEALMALDSSSSDNIFCLLTFCRWWWWKTQLKQDNIASQLCDVRSMFVTVVKKWMWWEKEKEKMINY
jgi:hypothetical protein